MRITTAATKGSQRAWLGCISVYLGVFVKNTGTPAGCLYCLYSGVFSPVGGIHQYRYRPQAQARSLFGKQLSSLQGSC